MIEALSPFLRHALAQKYAQQALMAMEPETAHGATISALKLGLVPSARADATELKTGLCGMELSKPIGMAAGFDKNAEVPRQLSKVGFGMVEVGTITPRPQTGNPKPRLFRLPEQIGVINRMGFNNQGHDAAYRRLQGIRVPAIVGINVGANKDSEGFVIDYVEGVKRFAPLADYLTINISSPNTPGLRALQGREALDELLSKLKGVRDNAGLDTKPPLLLKIAPDLDNNECEDIAEIILKHQMDGLIVSNTTLSREGLGSAHKDEAGGLSGQPLFELSTKVLSRMFELTEGQIPLVGVGGIGSGAQAYAKIRAGASLVQLYSALVYGGPGLVRRINDELEALIKKDGLSNITEAIGLDHK